MDNHGTDPARADAVMRERIEAMKAIWTSDEASYHGKHVSFDRIWSWPKLLCERHRQYRDTPPCGPVVAIDVERWTGWQAA
jgi:alkanesulfonate monooxygenase SsuD/methylene tetrahydromethanopterin reductase-like flavin-dependent oxidoreductase (luciferase family)